MCGIVGRAGPLLAADERMFKVLLLLDWFRGQDSTGVASVTKKGSVTTLKVADDPIILMQHQDYETIVAGVSDAIWIGHNRASTVGASVRANAHPFTCGNITGVHNGTLTKESLSALRRNLEETYETDSETIFAHMDLLGVEKTLRYLEGAWALVWYNSKDKTLNMLRNTERPLYTCEYKRKHTENRVLTWASEYRMITAAYDYTDSSDELILDSEGFGYFQLPVDVLHTWALGDLVAGITERVEKVPMPGLPVPPKVTTVTYPSTSPVTTFTPATLVPDKEEIHNISIVEDDEVEGHYFGGRISSDAWNGMASYGCSYCGTDVLPSTPGIAVFPEEMIVLCPSCLGESVTTIGGNIHKHIESLC